MAPYISTTKKKRTKGGQVWSIDFALAILLLSGAILIFSQYVFSLSSNHKERAEILMVDALSVADAVMSEGSPHGWQVENVTQLGIIGEPGYIDQGKVKVFEAIAKDEYPRSQKLLSTTYDYLINFTRNGNFTEVDGISYLGKSGEDVDEDNLIAINRFGFYNGSILNIEILL